MVGAWVGDSLVIGVGTIVGEGVGPRVGAVGECVGAVGRSVGIFVGSSKGFAAFAASSSTPGSFESSISLSSSSPPTETAPKLLSLRLVGDGVGTIVTPFLVGAADGAAECVGNAVGPSVGNSCAKSENLLPLMAPHWEFGAAVGNVVGTATGALVLFAHFLVAEQCWLMQSSRTKQCLP